MLIPDNTGNWVPAGRMARTRTTNFWAGHLPDWVTVTDGAPAASPRPAGGLRLTGSTVAFDATDEIVLSDIPTSPDVEGARRVRLDLHFTNGAMDGELFSYGLKGPNGAAVIEKRSAGAGAALRLTAYGADGKITADSGTNTEIGSSATGAGSIPDKRYVLTYIYDPYDRHLYISEGDALQDVFVFPEGAFAPGPVTPYVKIWSANGTTELVKDFHQITITSEWL